MFQRNYDIKKGYKPRSGTIYKNNSDLNLNQLQVNGLAVFLANRGNYKYIISLGSIDIENLTGLNDDIKIIIVDKAANLTKYKNKPNIETKEFNLDEGLPEFEEELLRQSVVISLDKIGRMSEPHKFLKGLKVISDIAPYILVSTSERTRTSGPYNFGPPANPNYVREWSMDEFYSLFKKYKIKSKIGYSSNELVEKFKDISLIVSGTNSVPLDNLVSDKRIIAIITAYNEQDIIEHSVEHLITQGVDVHVIDNWSTDKTFEIVKKLAHKHPNVTYEQYPEIKPKVHKYEWSNLLKKVEDVAASLDYDWIIHNDADEFRMSPWKNLTLKEAISFVDLCGYNAIDFTIIEFRPTKDGYDGTIAPFKFFSHFEFPKHVANFMQIKAWKYSGRVELAGSGGHTALFPDRKLFPFKFISRHYPLRSKSQAGDKIFKNRNYDEEELKKGWHVQYSKYSKDDPFLWSTEYLLKFSPDFFYTEYMVELISGIGLEESYDT